MKYRLILIISIFALSLLAFSCGGNDEDDETVDYGGDGLCDACMDAAPDPSFLQLTVPGYEENSEKSKAFSPCEDELGEMACYYHDTVDICRALNYFALGYLSVIDELLSYWPTSHDGEYCIWGPFTDPYTPPTPSVARFMMRRQSATVFDYYWQERPKDSTSDDDWQDIWNGDIVPSTSTSRRGIGSMMIDHTTAKELDPTRNSSGLVEVQYDTFTGDARAIDITFTDFAFDEFTMPTDATYHYYNDSSDDGEFVFSIDMEFYGGTVPETWTYETLWEGNGSGVATVTIDGGDLDTAEWPETGSGVYIDKFVGIECWGDDFARTYYEQKLHLSDATVIDLEDPQGDPSTCVF